jgi:hypothetical protein
MPLLHNLNRSIHAAAHRGQVRDAKVVPAKRPQPNLQELVRKNDGKVRSNGVVSHREVDGSVCFVVAGYKLELSTVDAPRRARRGRRVESAAGTSRLRYVIVAAGGRVGELEMRRGREGQGQERRGGVGVAGFHLFRETERIGKSQKSEGRLDNYR